MAKAALAATSDALDELKQLERKERELEQRVRLLEWKESGNQGPAPTTEGHEQQPRVLSNILRSGDDEQATKRRALPTTNEPDLEPKPSRLSSVVAARPAASAAGDRPSAPATQDEQVKSRNKRMFGALVLGTLQKAQKDIMTDAKLSRRQEIDKELQAKAEGEREELKKQAAAERESSQKELEEVRKQKLEKQAQVTNARKAHYDKLYANFRKTQTLPAVFWRPKDKEAPAAAPASTAAAVVAAPVVEEVQGDVPK